MDKRYCCAKCGKELKKNEYMVNLAPLIFMGKQKEDITAPVYISKGELDSLVKGKKTNGDGFWELDLSIKEFLQYAYGESNKKFLQDAYAENNNNEFLDVDSIRVAQVCEAMEIELGLRSAPEKPEPVPDAAKNEQTNIASSLGLNYLPKQPVNPVQDKKDFCIPGFTEAMCNQALDNFEKGKIRIALRENREVGAQFFNYSYKKRDEQGDTGDGRHCPYCAGRILDGAYDKTQFLIGIVGFKNVGKSCLIAALCESLKKMYSGAPLVMPVDKWKAEYEKELENYRKGCTLQKTAASGENTYHPSIATKDSIWTFVDVPGEAILDEETELLNHKALMNKFDSITLCDAYIFCANYRAISESKDPKAACAQMTTVFGSLLDNLNSTVQGRPVLFALTQEDEPIVDNKTGGELISEEEESNMKNCVHDSYLYYKETKFLLQKEREEIRGVLEQLAGKCYLTAITCSAYGLKPVSPKEYDPDNPRELKPKNIQTIIEWVQQLYGKRGVPARGEENGAITMEKGYMLLRSEKHSEKNEWEYISRMFANPSDLDRQYIDAAAGGFGGIVKGVGLKFRSIFRVREKRSS